jgi:hypothetical protein
LALPVQGCCLPVRLERWRLPGSLPEWPAQALQRPAWRQQVWLLA